MKQIVWAVSLALLAPAAQADAFCEEVWVSRNLIFDRAGYCFGSALGQAVFDNGDCVTSSPDLTPEQADKVARLREVEDQYECRINTARTGLAEFTEMARLRALRDLPVPDGLESACIGYLGAKVTLRNGHHPDADVVGAVQGGDTILFGHFGEGDWVYVELQRGNQFDVHGWTQFPSLAEEDCETWAG